MRRFAVHFALAVSLILGFALVLNGSVLEVLTGTWRPAGNMSSARTNATAVLVSDGRIVFAGGTDLGGQPTALVDAFSSSGTFSSLPAMTAARSGHAAILTLSGDLLVTGGRTSGGAVTNSVETFDSLTNTWQSLPATMVEPRSGHTVSQLQDGNVLIAGGENSSGPVAALEVYDLVSSTFRFAGVLVTARKGHSAATLLDGRVLIVGGTTLQADGSTATLASTEIYDPANGTVSAGPNLATPRTGATATTLLDGRVLIAGGSYPEGAPNTAAELASAEIFDPVSGTITASASQMSTPRSGHIAILLPNNNSVLIAGGTSAEAALPTAELYMPWNDAFQQTGSMSSARTFAAGSALGNGTYFGIDGLAVVAGGNNQIGAEVYGFATVKTDKPDYYPGETVTITGTGWQPGETVQLRLRRSDGTITQLTALADGTGRIVNSAYTTTTADFQTTFVITAMGTSSQAQNIFSDAKDLTTTTITCSPATAAAGITTTCTATVADTTNPSFTPTGDVVTWAASVAGGTFTPSSPIKCTLNSSAQCSVTYRSPSAASITISAHYQGDGTGQSGHQASDGSFTLNATAATQTTAANAAASYSTLNQTVALSATVASSSTVNAGTVTFTVKNSSNATIGSPVTSGTVSGGSASANFTLPANTPTGTYSINAAYSGATGFAASSDSTHTLTVGQANQSITFDALAGKTYGDPDFTVSATASSGLPVWFSSLTTGICTVSGDQVHIVANGTCTVRASQAGDTNWNAAANVEQGFTVGKKLATWTTNPASKTYGDPEPTPLTTGSGSGFLAADGVSATYSRAAGETVLGGPYHITATLSATVAGALDNYTITNTGANFTINPKPATWTTNPASKTYGDPEPTPLTTGSGSGFLESDGVSATYARAAGETVPGGPYHITATLSASVAGALDNYTITNAGANFTINTRPVTVTPSSGQNKIYGADDPVLAYTITSGNLIGTDTFTGTLSRDSGQNIGLYDILGGSLTLGSNYKLTITPGIKFEIKPRPITVTADKQSKVYGDPDPALTFTVGGNGLAYSETLANTFTGALARAAGESVLGGAYAITQGNLAANSNYVISSFIPGQLNITPASLSITPDGGKSKVYGDPFTSFTGTTTGLKFSDAVNVTYASPGSALNASVGSYDITVAAVAFTTGAASNYNIATGIASNGLVVTQRPVTITADAKSKAYLAPDPALTYHISSGNLLNGDTFTGNLTRVSGELPGMYAIQRGTAGLSPNYSLSYIGANLTIGYGQCSAAIGPGSVILPPINSDGTSVYPRKGGSTVPVKFRVCDYQGNSISNPAAVFAGTGGSLSMLSAVRGTVTVVNEDGATDIPDVAFRWSGDQWIFNMATSNLASATTYQFRINLAYGNIGFVVGVK